MKNSEISNLCKNIFSLSIDFVSKIGNKPLLTEYLKKLNIIDKVNIKENINQVSNSCFNISGEALNELSIIPSEEIRSVLSISDFCITSFGKRLLRSWISCPNLNIGDLIKRQRHIQEFSLKHYYIRKVAESNLKNIGDLDKILSSCKYPDFSFQKMNVLLSGVSRIIVMFN